MPKLKRRSISQRNSEMARRTRERRTDDEFRLSDNRKRANSHRIEREVEEFKKEDNERRAAALKISREDEEFKTEEKKRNASRIQNNRDKYKNNFDAMKSNFESKIKEGPTNICSCCGGLWFDYSIKKCTVEMLLEKGFEAEFIEKICYLKYQITKFCVTCRKDILSNEVPNLSLSNG